MNYKKIVKLPDIDVKNKSVLLRLDLNVPVIDGKITSYKRINETLKTINYLLDQNAKIVITSHLGRPKSKEDLKKSTFDLKNIASELFNKIKNKNKKKFFFVDFTTQKDIKNSDDVKRFFNSLTQRVKNELNYGDIMVLQNTRFHDVDHTTGKLINWESEMNDELSQLYANLCDVYINDAFGAAHRKHASTHGVAKHAKTSGIGFLMQSELDILNNVVKKARSPFLVIFGGAKISDKLKAVNAVIKKADKVIISGGMAYTFVAAQGYNVGKSMVEESMLDTARELMAKYGDKLCISSDFMCAKTFSNEKPIYRTKEEGLEGYMGLDIGPRSIEEFKKVIASANTILWNGPMGVTEFSNYAKGTIEVCNAIAERTKKGAFTVIGGGDSAAAAEKLGKEKSFSFISTGGGASLRLIEGSELEGISSINKKKRFFFF